MMSASHGQFRGWKKRKNCCQCPAPERGNMAIIHLFRKFIEPTTVRIDRQFNPVPQSSRKLDTVSALAEPCVKVMDDDGDFHAGHRRMTVSRQGSRLGERYAGKENAFPLALPGLDRH